MTPTRRRQWLTRTQARQRSRAWTDAMIHRDFREALAIAQRVIRDAQRIGQHQLATWWRKRYRSAELAYLRRCIDVPAPRDDTRDSCRLR